MKKTAVLLLMCFFKVSIHVPTSRADAPTSFSGSAREANMAFMAAPFYLAAEKSPGLLEKALALKNSPATGNSSSTIDVIHTLAALQMINLAATGTRESIVTMRDLQGAVHSIVAHSDGSYEDIEKDASAFGIATPTAEMLKRGADLNTDYSKLLGRAPSFDESEGLVRGHILAVLHRAAATSINAVDRHGTVLATGNAADQLALVGRLAAATKGTPPGYAFPNLPIVQVRNFQQASALMFQLCLENSVVNQDVAHAYNSIIRWLNSRTRNDRLYTGDLPHETTPFPYTFTVPHNAKVGPRAATTPPNADQPSHFIAYPVAAQEANAEGKVMTRCDIHPDGTPLNCHILHTTNHVFDAAALSAATRKKTPSMMQSIIMTNPSLHGLITTTRFSLVESETDHSSANLTCVVPRQNAPSVSCIPDLAAPDIQSTLPQWVHTWVRSMVEKRLFTAPARQHPHSVRVALTYEQSLSAQSGTRVLAHPNFSIHMACPGLNIQDAACIPLDADMFPPNNQSVPLPYKFLSARMEITSDP